MRDPDKFVEEISRHIEELEATLAEPSAYNRFLVNRIRDFIAGNSPTFYNDTEIERRFDFSKMNEKERLDWIADDFANMQWSCRRNDFKEKEVFFKQEITSFGKAKLWCDFAEIQLVPKKLMIPLVEVQV